MSKQLWKPRRQPPLTPAEQARKKAWIANIRSNATPGVLHMITFPGRTARETPAMTTVEPPSNP